VKEIRIKKADDAFIMGVMKAPPIFLIPISDDGHAFI